MSLPQIAAPGNRPGGVFKGVFTLDTVADTFLNMSKYQKGYVWVNGHNLGRYWNIGPQYLLYCPAPWLKKGRNEIVVLDLHLHSRTGLGCAVPRRPFAVPPYFLPASSGRWRTSGQVRGKIRGKELQNLQMFSGQSYTIGGVPGL